LVYNKPLPIPNQDTKPFWDACAHHELIFQKCIDCNYTRWPPSYICSACHSFNYRWIKSKGRGKIYAFVVYHKAFHPSFEEDLPYITAVVELEEGPRILTNIIECDLSEIECETQVELVWDRVTGEFSLPKFKPIRSILQLNKIIGEVI
jgi:uncharacterized OB-fold protein